MNILAIETTDKSGSVALLSGDDLLLERILPSTMRSAQTLAPTIDEILRELRLLPSDIGRVAVVIGPGSFTGLRVGVVTAKVFAYAVGAEIIGLSTFEVIAFSCDQAGESGLVSIGVDAQRGEVVVQDWSLELSGNCCCLSDATMMMSVEDWQQHSVKRNTEYSQNFTFAGPALRRFGSKFPATAKITDENLFEPRAGTAAQLAKNKLPTSNVWTTTPIYSRPSAADEKRS
ncbi:MAG: tRNA (adenosine(37)-N6)-threonylcarbamoyltransferase complex dimerization subunit type 1 TsaB [Planctomycetaceae bacterium]|jgi:tRNA threonylcarbamoyladenosine biosynthesis protein TsaB|nr:tRNA (adenosine(37)-N6)-threonylcarbamoyltransferase complex dimerization subunit type 1 TsaB [Planctomycetaceae bacterium]